MQKVIMTKGLSGSGKSYWSENFCKENPNFEITCKDDIREELGLPWSKELESKVLEIQDSKIVSLLEKGRSVIVSDTNLSSKHKSRIQDICDKFEVELEVKSFLDVPIELCIARDSLREKPVGEKVIRNQYKNLVLPELKRRSNADLVLSNLKYMSIRNSYHKYIIVDIDGTLAVMNNRSPFEWDKVGNDLPNQRVIDFINSMVKTMGYKVIVMSGRDSVCHGQTADWLRLNKIKADFLIMRDQGDSRPDEIIKLELYNKYIKDIFPIAFVVDDRPKVVRMWRSLGLFVFDVNQSGFEF